MTSLIDTNNIEIEIKQSAKDLPLPSYATAGSSGLDLCANLSDSIIIEPQERALIPTGISIALPLGFEAQIRPRSGLAAKNGITVLNTPGTIDSDYRGEIQIILINLSKTSFTVTHGMRIAQMVVQPITKISLKRVELLSETKRGVGGFGSTGV